MLSLSELVRIYVCLTPTDMRKSRRRRGSSHRKGEKRHPRTSEPFNRSPNGHNQRPQTKPLDPQQSASLPHQAVEQSILGDRLLLGTDACRTCSTNLPARPR